MGIIMAIIIELECQRISNLNLNNEKRNDEKTNLHWKGTIGQMSAYNLLENKIWDR